MRKHGYRRVFLFTLSGREVIEEVWLSARQLSAVFVLPAASRTSLPASHSPQIPPHPALTCPSSHVPYLSARLMSAPSFGGCRVCISPDRAAADSPFLCHAGVLTAWDSNQHLSPSQPGDSGGKSQVGSRLALQHANDLLQNFPRSTQQSFPLLPLPPLLPPAASHSPGTGRRSRRLMCPPFPPSAR